MTAALFAELANASGATVKKGIEGAHFYIERAGRRLKISRIPKGNAGSRLLVEVPAERLPPIVLRQKATLDRFGKWVGLNHALQTGDPEFDEGVYVETWVDDETVAALLNRVPVRRRVLELLNAGFSVELGNGLRLESKARNSFELAPERLEYAFAQLDALLAALRGAPTTFRLSPRRWSGFAFASALGFVLLVLLPWALPLGFDARPIDSGARELGALCGLAAALALEAVLYFVVRRTATGLRWFGVASIALLLGLPLSGASGLPGINEALDDSPREVHPTRVITSTPLQQRGGNYYVWLESWRHDGKSERVPTTPVELTRLGAPGSELEVTTRSGALGFAWVESLRRR